MCGGAVDEDVVGSLNIEGLLNFCVWGDEEVERNEGGYEAQESNVCRRCQLVFKDGAFEMREGVFLDVYLGASLWVSE